MRNDLRRQFRGGEKEFRKCPFPHQNTNPSTPSQRSGGRKFANKADQWISIQDEPDHDGLCRREQNFFFNAILNDSDLSTHLEAAINSMRVVAAANESFRSSKTVQL